MKGSDFLKEHNELIGLLGNTSKALRKEALAQTQELTRQLMKNPTRKNALVLAKRGANNLGKRMTTRGKRVVLRRGNPMGSGFLGDVFEDLAIDGAKKLYRFDKEHGSHLKEGVKQGFKNMISNVFKGGNGLKEELEKIKMKNRIPNMNDNMIRPAVMPEGWDRKQPDYTNDISGWIEKERRSTGYYDRHPLILGEGM